jgi:two-component system cell cycle sensor histidine kinase/response regulator CckA
MTSTKTDSEEAVRLCHALYRQQIKEAVCNFAAGIAHEFNNLLFILAANAEMAVRTIRSGKIASEEVDQIMEGIKRGVALSRQLQIFGRFDAGEPLVVCVNDVLNGIAQQLRCMLGEKVELVVAPGSDPWSVLIDRRQLENAITNISTNASDAMPDGGTLTIESTNVEIGSPARSLPDPARYVLIRASDTGVGMEPEILERIFEPLFTTGETYKHAGLGLCMVENIVAHAGGYISVTSKPGCGTSFDIYLPATDVSET